jgi:hypothetical protein
VMRLSTMAACTRPITTTIATRLRHYYCMAWRKSNALICITGYVQSWHQWSHQWHNNTHAIELTPSLVNMLTHEAASFFYVCHYLTAVLSRKQPCASVPAPLLLLLVKAYTCLANKVAVGCMSSKGVGCFRHMRCISGLADGG